MQGAEIIGRDGRRLLECFRPEIDVGTYSELSAALTAASQIALPILLASRRPDYVSRNPARPVVLVEANEELLLAALIERTPPSDELMSHLRYAADGVGRIAEQVRTADAQAARRNP